MHQAAIFDIDSTLLKGNIGLTYSIILMKKGFFKPVGLIKIFYYALQYKLGRINYDKAMKSIYTLSKGWKKKELENYMDKYYSTKIRPRIYGDMRRAITEHRKERRIIIFATNGWNIMAENLAKDLNPDIFLATEAEISEGKCTGKLKQVCHSWKKAELVKNTATKHNIDLKKSFAYSDHISDRFLLESVGTAFAVHPDRKLKKLAEKKGWRIIYPK